MSTQLSMQPEATQGSQNRGWRMLAKTRDTQTGPGVRPCAYWYAVPDTSSTRARAVGPCAHWYAVGPSGSRVSLAVGDARPGEGQTPALPFSRVDHRLTNARDSA
ncbi:unnamed protein product [Rhizoctonia solani]|nr:unnamed protein product [Rhizoctonia solani]